MNNQRAARCGIRWNMQVASSAPQPMVGCGKGMNNHPAGVCGISFKGSNGTSLIFREHGYGTGRDQPWPELDAKCILS